MKKISIIMPVYNAEKFVDNSIKSLLNQTLKDIEIILVNDGSKDNSLDILKSYEDKYDNVIVIDQKNGGPGAARNSGLKVANGEYIAYIDCDDFVAENMYENLYNKAKTKDFDVVECNFMYTDGKKNWGGVHDLDSDIFSLNEKKEYMTKMYPVLWNKIYKFDVIKDIFFTEGVFAEDVEYLYRILPNINTIGYVSDVGYYYYQRLNSESNNYNENIYDYITNFNYLVDYYKSKGFYDTYKNEIEYCYVRYIYATFIKRTTFFDKDEYLKAINIAIKNVKEKFPNYKKNKYINRINCKNIYLKYFNNCFAKIVYWLQRYKI